MINLLQSAKRVDVRLIDARGPRFGAVLTTAVLVALFISESLPLALWQLGVFAIGAFIGPQATPYAWIYRTLVKERLRDEVPTEDSRPPRFAQAVGFLFALTATMALLIDSFYFFHVAVGFALVAAFLNAAFDFCLGCEMYLFFMRVRRALSRRKNHEDWYNLPNL